MIKATGIATAAFGFMAWIAGLEHATFEILSQFITPGILLGLALVFGLWLSLSGKPSNGILFTIHKLIALGAVVVAGIQVDQALSHTGNQAVILAALGLAVLSVLALFASGALMSLGKLDYRLVLGIHRAALVLLPFTLAAVIYLMNGS